MQTPVSEAKYRPESVAIVLKGYPRLSETFIAQEILGLERKGLDIHIVSLRHPTDPTRHEIHEAIAAGVTYLPEYLHHEPRRVARCLWRQLRNGRFWSMLGIWTRDFCREPTRNRLRRIGQALVMAGEMPPGTRRIYAHFIHTPGSVARYAARLTGLPYSLSAHAKDIWTTPRQEIREKLADARWTVCCTRTNTGYLRDIEPSAHIELVYHGLDVAALPKPDRSHRRDGSEQRDPCRILCVARAVEKKGIDLLLQAMARLPDDLHWQFTHVGGGEKGRELQQLAIQLEIADRVDWLGALSRNAVMQQMNGADIFCLPARIAADGDRDGLPNVLLEALSQELAVATTPTGGIGELIDDGENGLIVGNENIEALAAALERLIRNPGLRARFGHAGRLRVERDFAADAGIGRIADMLNGMT